MPLFIQNPQNPSGDLNLSGILNLNNNTDFVWNGAGQTFAKLNVGTAGTAVSNSLFVRTLGYIQDGGTGYATGLAINGTYPAGAGNVGDAVIQIGAYGVDSPGGFGSALSFLTTFNTATTERLRIGNDGAILMSNLAGTGTRAVLASSTGILSAPVSDARLKTNIAPIDKTLVMDMLKDPAIRAINFNWKDPKRGADTELGMTYQMLEPYKIPGLTFFDNGYGGINYDKLGVIALEQNKIQEEEINNLIKRLDALEAKYKE
jgi:hypothetical protein